MACIPVCRLIVQPRDPSGQVNSGPKEQHGGDHEQRERRREGAGGSHASRRVCVVGVNGLSVPG